MTLRKTTCKHDRQIQIGFIFLGLASLSKWFLHPGPQLSDQLTDGITGLLYGISIGFMLLGVWRRNRQDGSEE